LGDSFTKTQDSSGKTYLDLFAAELSDQTGTTVTVDDRSDDASTSDGLADRLANDAATKEAVAAADIVLVSVGGNDSDPFGVYPPGTCAPDQAQRKCLQTYAPRFAANYHSILDAITTLRAGRPTAIRVTSADNPFVGWSEAPDPGFGVRFYRQVAEAETAAACRIAKANGALCVDYLHIFGGPDGTQDPKPYLASDHAHPGDKGIRAIADELARIGVPELS
jgi:lysophospholipase L1-like esterase